jgi:hypothetical protein
VPCDHSSYLAIILLPVKENNKTNAFRISKFNEKGCFVAKWALVEIDCLDGSLVSQFALLVFEEMGSGVVIAKLTKQFKFVVKYIIQEWT